ncbi:permease [Halobacteriales archaeon QS_9_67_17]|nr:MAG: permease [Halobacteriales archaeon QS_9_67_17]
MADLNARVDEIYRRYLGEPERDLDVYLGFALFIGGIALGIVGLLLFGFERAAASDGPLWALRELAFVVGALGLPILLLGVTVLLPVDRRASYAAGVGATITLAAAAFFVSVYPSQWNVTAGQDFSFQGVVVYAVGLVTVISATGAALVSYHVERTRGVPAGEATGAGTAATSGASGSAATDGTAGSALDEEAVAEQAQRDYEEAMEDADISWGGVEKTDVSRRLSVDTGEVDDVDTSGFDPDSATQTRSSSSNVDAAVEGLNAMRGEDPDAERSDETTDDQAAALAELRQQQAHEEQQQKQKDGVVGKLKDRLGMD